MNPPDAYPEDQWMSMPESQVPTTLLTQRLVMRPFENSDAELVEILLNDKEIASNSRSIDYPYPAGDALKWIARHQIMWNNGDSYNFAIRLNASDQLIGSIGLDANKLDHSAELGYWLGREFWNCGFCTEAAKRVVEFGFETIGLHRITSHHFARNPASGRVLEKAGMTKEGRLRSHVRKWGVFEDVVLYGMLASDPRP